MTLNEPPSTTTASGRPPWFWGSLACGALVLALIVTQAASLWRGERRISVPGWNAVHDAAGWTVHSVEPGGPAQGRLEPGDRLLAMNGDERVARLGPAWAVRELRPGASYTLVVRRGSDTLPVRLAIDERPSPGWRARVAAYLFVALTYLAMGLMIGLARPDDRVVLYGFGTCMATALLLLFASSGIREGVAPGAVERALQLVFPLHLFLSYLFFNAFPAPVPRRPVWSFVMAAVLTLGALTWLAQGTAVALQFAGVPAAHAAFDGWGRPFWLYWTFVRPAWQSFYVFLVGGLDIAMMWRNYRHLPGLNDRRRIVLTVAGQAAAIAPGFVLALALVLRQLADPTHGSHADAANQVAIANAFLVLAPIALGIAIVQRQVLGIHLVVRLGIKYLLAHNVLRAAFLLPLAWLAVTLVSHRDQPIGALLFSQASGVNLLLLGATALAMRYRPRLDAAIDRRFFREAYDQEAILLRLVESVKSLDSTEDIALLVRREIDRALHPTRVIVLLEDPRDGTLRARGESPGSESDVVLAPASPLLSGLGDSGALRTLSQIRRTSPGPRRATSAAAGRAPGPAARAHGFADHERLRRLGIEVVVPVAGVAQQFLGLLLLGAKRSDEPYTRHDANLLRMLATQIGAVYEVMLLRDTVGRQREAAREVLGRLDERGIHPIQECPRCGTVFEPGADICVHDGSRLALTLPIERTVESRYRLERRIGSGGMGAVYEATDLRLGRRVAFKVMTADLGDERALRRFAREAQAVARVDHPAIVPIFDYGPLGGSTAFIVLQLVRGPTLRVELERAGVFAREDAADVLEQACAGVAAAHAAGLLHRDLKPENLILEPAPRDGRPTVRILDFGLAKIHGEDNAITTRLTETGVTMGTFGYMSPEQMFGQEVDERTDVFSLGVIAIELLTGPLALSGARLPAVVQETLAGRLAALTANTADEALAGLLARAVAQARDDRFGGVREMGAALGPALRGGRGVR